MDEPAFTGCLVRSRMLGVIEAEQTEKGETNRNDRLIAVASKSRAHADVKSISDMNPKLLRRDRAFLRLLERGEREEVQAARAIRPGAGAEIGAAWETHEKTLTTPRVRGTSQLQIAAHYFKYAVNKGSLL